jgi:DNA-binding transcriptional regulator YdaS (Cro superfamily)
MDAKTYFTERDGRVHRDGDELRRVAAECEVTPGTLYLVALGHKIASAKLACQIEHATRGYVDRRDTLPEFPWDAPLRAADEAA